MSVERQARRAPLGDTTDDYYPSRVEAAPRWIFRHEPAVYSAPCTPAPVSAAQHEAFERNGFIIVDDLFDTREIEALQEELETLRRNPAPLARETLIEESGARLSLRSIFSIHTQSALFKRLSADSRLVNIARYLLGDDVYIHQSRLNYKPGFNGKEFYWHSDFETWHVEDGMPRMRAVSMSLLLNENTHDNGPLMLIPGSHKHFIACVGETPEDHYKQSLRKQEYGVPDRESLSRLVDAGGITAATGKAGTLVVFDCNTMHGSNGNITPASRANAFVVYNAVSNALEAPFSRGRPRPEFIAARGRPQAVAPIIGRLDPSEG
ncbi:MAG: ectoine hydroxylase [Hyphomonadaceae bacterium]